MSDKDKDAAAVAVAAVATPAPVRPAQQVRAVYGKMVDISTGEAYTQKPCVCEKITPWMQMQVDAGKMEVL
jgi:hypothetical protein